MSAILTKDPRCKRAPIVGTSALGAMRAEPPLASRENLYNRSLFTTYFTSFIPHSIVREWVDNSERVVKVNQQISAAQITIHNLRKLSGLTWEQIANLFGVTRRSVHFWASGQQLSGDNEEHLYKLFATISYIDRGSAVLNRSLLLKCDLAGNSMLSLLSERQYSQVREILGAGNAPQRATLGKLSDESGDLGMPAINPGDLIDALQDPIHREVGKSRLAKAARSRVNSD